MPFQRGAPRRSRGERIWRSKGSVLLEHLRESWDSRNAATVPRLCGAPLSADEYFLNAMAEREDLLGSADNANIETFGESSGWDAEDMLAAHDRIREPPLQQYLVGTCGFMGTVPNKYASRFACVELNSTFHDRGNMTYESQAANYARLGLHIVVKVSGYATHDVALENPSDWWPWLRHKYAAFVNVGILIGFLWQLPPSFTQTDDTLHRLNTLGALLRAPGQTPEWIVLRHVFEFRHASWYNNSQVTETLQRHALCNANLHVMNDTGWAGNLESGWNGGAGAVSLPDFAYFRCFGSAGRSIGKYDIKMLQHIAERVRSMSSAIVMFGQGDVPAHALENAREMNEIIKTGVSNGQAPQWIVTMPSSEACGLVSGRVVAITKNWDRRIILDIGGRRGFLGTRHSRKRGLQTKIGTVLQNLRIEAEQDGWLILSVHGTAACCDNT